MPMLKWYRATLTEDGVLYASFATYVSQNNQMTVMIYNWLDQKIKRNTQCYYQQSKLKAENTTSETNLPHKCKKL